MRRQVWLAVFAFLGCLSLLSPGLALAESKEEFLEALSSAPPEVVQPVPSPIQAATIQSICSPDCKGAGSASCTGTSCSSIDRNCAAGERGHATCEGTTVYCNPCPSPACSATVNCGTTSVSCTGDTSCTPTPRSCPGQRGYVTCDGVKKFCPFCTSPQPCGTEYCHDGATCTTDADCGCTQYGSCSASNRCGCR